MGEILSQLPPPLLTQTTFRPDILSAHASRSGWRLRAALSTPSIGHKRKVLIGFGLCKSHVIGECSKDVKGEGMFRCGGNKER